MKGFGGTLYSTYGTSADARLTAVNITGSGILRFAGIRSHGTTGFDTRSMWITIDGVTTFVGGNCWTLPFQKRFNSSLKVEYYNLTTNFSYKDGAVVYTLD